MSRKKIVAGNWKMNKTYQEGLDLATQIKNSFSHNGVTVILATPFLHLHGVLNILGVENLHLHVAAQNCHHESAGAFTGEVSVKMLQSIGIQYVIVGHSERRLYQHESNEQLAKKVDTLLAHNMTPIFCCGEPLEVRLTGQHIKFVAEQLKESLFHLSAADFSKIILAYEPIWAIGTGVTASTEQAQETQQAIRQLVENQYNKSIAENLSILYGGSCNAKNAKELFAQNDVDGGLIGGASLVAADFLTIVDSF